MRIQKVSIALVFTLMFALAFTLMLTLLAGKTAPEPKTGQIGKAFAAQPPTATFAKEKAGRDGARMVLIPAGEFQMGSNDSDDDGDESPVYTVYLDAFYMDMYEVTNEQYARFLNQYGSISDDSGRRLIRVGDGDCFIEKVGNTYRPKWGCGDRPVAYVSWYGAAEYAHFYGKRLPTAAEWEKAARGGLVGKKYPWGDSISHYDANYGGPGGKGMWKGTSPVGSFPPNGYGLYDMAGNVGEWCADWYGRGYYTSSPKANPVGPGSGNYRVLHGGSWLCNTNGLRAANRGMGFPTSTYSCHWGFRCVEDVIP